MHKRKPLNPRQVKQVKKIVSKEEELKYFLAAQNGVAITSTAAIVPLSSIPQGISDTQRVGDALEYKNLEVRMFLSIGNPTNLVRIIFFQWFPTATTPIATNILLTGYTGSIDTTSTYSHDYRHDFKVLKDLFCPLIGNLTVPVLAPAVYTDTTIRVFHFHLRGFRKQVQFAGGTTQGSNQLYVLQISDSPAAPRPVIALSTKLTFVDA